MLQVEYPLTIKGLHACCKQGSTSTTHPLCKSCPHIRYGSENTLSHACNMANVNSKEVRKAGNAVKNVTTAEQAPAEKDVKVACRTTGKNRKRSNARNSEPDGETSFDFRKQPRTPSEVSLDSHGNQDEEEALNGSKSRHTPSHKKNSLQSRRITEFFPVSNTTRFKDDCEEENRSMAASAVIDSTLLEEALYADDIAKAQSDLQDYDVLSLSQTQGHARQGNTEEEEERKRKRKKCSRLQETILKLMTKAKQDLEHLDDKIKTLETQYFAQPPDTVGLIRGWEYGQMGGSGYGSSNSKPRKIAPTKVKHLNTQAQAFITEHIFSLTSSTSATSNALLNKQE